MEEGCERPEMAGANGKRRESARAFRPDRKPKRSASKDWKFGLGGEGERRAARGVQARFFDKRVVRTVEGQGIRGPEQDRHGNGREVLIVMGEDLPSAKEAMLCIRCALIPAVPLALRGLAAARFRMGGMVMERRKFRGCREGGVKKQDQGGNALADGLAVDPMQEWFFHY
jgi:hypothetical protein